MDPDVAAHVRSGRRPTSDERRAAGPIRADARAAGHADEATVRVSWCASGDRDRAAERRATACATGHGDGAACSGVADPATDGRVAAGS